MVRLLTAALVERITIVNGTNYPATVDVTDGGREHTWVTLTPDPILLARSPSRRTIARHEGSMIHDSRGSSIRAHVELAIAQDS